MAAVAIGVGARAVLNPVLQDRLPFITVFLVLAPLAFLVRAGPFVAAMVLSFLGVLLLVLPPVGALASESLSLEVVIPLFASTALSFLITAFLARRQARRIMEAETRFRVAQEVSTDGFGLLTAIYADAPSDAGASNRAIVDFTIVYINKAAATMSGRKPEDMTGRRLTETITGSRERTFPIYKQVVETGEPFDGEVVFTGDGPHGWRRLQVRPLDGGVVVTMTDITTSKNAEIDRTHRIKAMEREVAERTRELQAALERLRVSERLATAGALAAGVAYQLSGLLLPLRTHAEVLGREAPAGPARNSARAIDDISRQLDRLARALRLVQTSASDDRAGPMAPADTSVAARRTDLVEWCQDVESLLSTAVLATGLRRVRVQCSVAEGLPPAAISPRTLTQAALSLVLASRDAMYAAYGPDATGLIRLTAEADTGADDPPDQPITNIRILIHDEGPEWTRDDAQPGGRRADASGRVLPAAWGQNRAAVLAVADVISAAGGTLEVSSAPRKGTTVVLRLPAVEPAEGRHAEDGTHPATANISIKDDRTRALVRSMLASVVGVVRDGAPVDGHDGAPAIWIGDAVEVSPEAAGAFVASGGGRRVIVLGGDDRWKRVGAETFPAAAGLSGLREVLAGPCH